MELYNKTFTHVHRQWFDARLALSTYTNPLVHIKALLFNEPVHQLNVPSLCCHVEEGLACLYEGRARTLKTIPTIQPYNV